MSNSKKDSSIQDLYYYKPLHILAKIFGILPFFDIDNLKNESKWKFWNGIVMVIFYLAIFIYSTIGRLSIMIYILPPTIFVTDYGGDCALILINITAIIRICFVKHHQIKTFLDHIMKIDAQLRTFGKKIYYPRKVFLLEFIFTNILFVIYYIYDGYIWITSVTWYIYKMYVLRDMQCFHMVLVSILIRNYSLTIRNRMRILNEILLKMRPPIDEPPPHNSDQKKVKLNKAQIITSMATSTNLQTKPNKHRERVLKEHRQLLKMRQIYSRICVSMGIFNDIFGWIYLTLYISIVVYLLTSTNIGLVYGVGDKKMGNTDFGVPLVILCVLWSALPLIVGVFIFASADKVFFEIKRTPIICYSIIDGWLPFDEDHILVPELERFAQQVTNSHPEIIAAGFFEVDYAIFFALIGSMSSYIIVLIQFMYT